MIEFRAAEPVTLAGRHVRLEPLSSAHLADLAPLADDPEIWRFMSFADLRSPAALQGWVQKAQAEQARGEGIAFAVVDAASGQAVGSTSLYDISAPHRRLELGRTWLGKPYRRTALNTEAKRLLLEHCFETLGCHRVQIKTDSRNLRSQAAIERIGAAREGVLRSHMVMPDGFVRDTVMYSIIAAEWPSVRTRLEALLAGRGTA